MMCIQSLLTRLVAATCVLLVVATAAPTAAAQEELLCDVSINYRQLQGSNFTFLEELEELAEEYINDNVWTNDRFLEEERINCTMQIVFREALTQTSFQAQLILTSSRPIYGTSATTKVLEINDTDWQFGFSQGTPLVFETERYNALTSMLDFYVYIILGYDYDTFSEFGGEEFFQKARRIHELAQSQSSLSGGNRRGQLIRQLLDPRFKPFRQAYFKYHFNGLDHFITETQRSRLVVLEVLATMQEVYDEVARSYAMDLFFRTKSKELAAIFEQSSVSSQAYGVLSEVDPSHLTDYNRLVQ